MSYNNQIVQGLPLEFVSKATTETYTIENHNTYVIVGATGGTLTVSIALTETPDYFDFTETIENNKSKAISIPLPKGAILKFTGATAKIGLWT